MKYGILIITIMLVTGCALFSPKLTQTKYSEFLEKNNIRTVSLIHERNYDGLISLYLKLEEDINRNIQFENTLFVEKDSLSQARLKLESQLNDFVGKYSKSYLPYYLRAIYLKGQSWIARGENFISQTTNEQVDGFVYYQELALKDIDIAISIKPKLYWLYVEKRLILVGKRDSEIERNEMAKAVKKLRPESYMFWNDVLHNSTLRWGGSIELMESLIKESESYWHLNPKLKSIQAAVLREKADNARFSGQVSKALELYKESLELGEHPYTYWNMGIIYFNSFKKELACRNFEKAYKLRPSHWNITQSYLACI